MKITREFRTMLNLKEPVEYLPYLNKYRNQSKYNKDVKLHIEKKCNRHTDTSGYSWGWYEVLPNGVVVGYWSKDKDDMEGFDLASWKIKASLL